MRLVYFLIIIAFSSHSLSGEVNYQLGSHKFALPSDAVPNLSPWRWLKSVVGLDNNVDDFVFEIPVENAVSLSLDRKLIGAMYSISPIEKERLYKADDLSDLWYSRNGYEDREVIFDEESGYYFVFEKLGYRGMFYVFSQPPEFEMPSSKKEFFIAICSGSNIEQLDHVSCSTQFLFNSELMIDVSYSLSDLKSQREIVVLLKRVFSEWKVPN